MANTVSQRFQADGALAFCSMLWGATFVVVQEALAFASVFVFMALRFGIAAAVLGGVYRSEVGKLSRAEILAGSQIGLFLFAGYAFQNAGLLSTTASKAAFITGFGVVLVPLLLALLWRRRIHAWAGVGAVAALAGLYFLTVPAGAGGLTRLNHGDLLALACAGMFALHIIFVGVHTPKFGVAVLSFVQIAACALFSVAAISIMSVAGLETPRVQWTGPLLVGVLITSLGATAIAFTLQTWAQRHTTPGHTAILLTLEPAFAALTSFLYFGERLGPRALLGAALILGGILLSELKGPIQSAPDSPGPVIGG
jgi:drug/metabolite transporter (DMT)-like permease